MSTITFNIPATKKSATEAQLIKFNKRARKLNMESLSWTFDKAFTKKVDRIINTGIDVITEEQNILFVPINITGDLNVSFDGWSFIATLQHLPTGENIIRSIGDLNFEIPVNYRNSGSACEHCNVRRYRKETYLVRHKDGDIVQVGSSCIKDFLGANTPETLMNKACLVSEIYWFMGGVETGGAGGDIVFPIVDFLAKTNAIINKFGWVSKKEASEQGKVSTATLVKDELFPASGVPYNPISVTATDTLHATNAVDWLESMSDEECSKSDYLHNIRAIARSGMVGMQSIGFAASIISAYNNKLKRDIPKVASQHIGNIKDKVTLDLLLKISYPIDSKFGLCYKYIFSDTKGNVLIWVASKDEMLRVGSKYLVSGTIKNHNEYNGQPQTILTRCKVLD